MIEMIAKSLFGIGIIGGIAIGIFTIPATIVALVDKNDNSGATALFVAWMVFVVLGLIGALIYSMF